MESPSPEDATILVELGLTTSEAKIYLALTQIGPSPTGPISKTTTIHRQHLYRSLNSLENKGLIKKHIEAIPNYEAIPIDEAITILLNRKQTQITQLKTKAQTTIQKLKQTNQQNTTNKNPQEKANFIMIPGTKTIIKTLKEAVLETKTSLEVITAPNRFSLAIVEFAQNYKEALDRGVKIRIATQKHTPEKAAQKIIQTLTENPNFQIKYFPEPPKAIVSIFDGKQAMVTLSATAQLETTSSLWSNNTSFIELAQNYFENKWNNTTNEEPQLKTIANHQTNSQPTEKQTRGTQETHHSISQGYTTLKSWFTQ